MAWNWNPTNAYWNHIKYPNMVYGLNKWVHVNTFMHKSTVNSIWILDSFGIALCRWKPSAAKVDGKGFQFIVTILFDFISLFIGISRRTMPQKFLWWVKNFSICELMDRHIFRMFVKLHKSGNFYTQQESSQLKF